MAGRSSWLRVSRGLDAVKCLQVYVTLEGGSPPIGSGSRIPSVQHVGISSGRENSERVREGSEAKFTLRLSHPPLPHPCMVQQRCLWHRLVRGSKHFMSSTLIIFSMFSLFDSHATRAQWPETVRRRQQGKAKVAVWTSALSLLYIHRVQNMPA